jgi:fumarate reductase subunit C
MKKTPTITSWLLWTPLKFATLSFVTMIAISFFYSWISSLAGITQSDTSTIILISIGIIGCLYYTIKRFKNTSINQKSFIAIHNAQSILSFILFSITGFLLFTNQHYIYATLAGSIQINPVTILVATVLLSIYLLYTLGLILINLYIKIKRISEFKIPTWKIIFSMPFGFSALWLPGYLIKTKTSPDTTTIIKSKWYNKFIDWIIATPSNTIAAFVFITLLSGFYVGLSTALLTFSMALIYGIWSLKIGNKEFMKRIPKSYSTTAVVINIIIIIALGAIYTSRPTVQNFELNITETTTQPTQGITQ